MSSIIWNQQVNTRDCTPVQARAAATVSGARYMVTYAIGAYGSSG